MTDIHDRAVLRALATQIRAGSRRYDPNVIAVSNTQRIQQQGAALVAALRRDGRQPASLTPAEQREVDRIIKDNPQHFARPSDSIDTGGPSEEEREIARILREQGLDR